MVLNVNIYSFLIIFVTYYFPLKCNDEYFVDDFFNSNNSGKTYKPGNDGCSIPVPPKHDFRRPRPSSLNYTKYDHHFINQEYRVKPGEFLRYSCDSGRIMGINKNQIAPEIIVKCSNESKVRFRNQDYYYDEFTCEDFPGDFTDMKVNSSSKSHLAQDIGPYDCFLPMHGIDYYMPIPFTTNTSTPMIIHPDLNGNLIVTQNTHFKFACTGEGNEFMSPGPRGKNELTVKCLNGTYIEFMNTLYSIFDFTCATVSKATLMKTDKTCNHGKHTVLEVGYQTHFSFLVLYRICFDTVHKDPKYAWYFANAPVYPERQMPRSKLYYIDTKTYGDIVPKESYYNQSKTIKLTLRSIKMADYYIKNEAGRFLTMGHLVPKKAFIYTFEQWATYHYENTVPQWYLYSRRVWKDLQTVINEKLSKDYTRHLIITGTYNITHLLERPDRTHPIYLSMPQSMTVPLYIWRLDYDMDRKNGTVYIGFNNPYKRIDQNVYFCEAMPCPTKLLSKKAYQPDLLFCCTKKDFERTYGPIDPVVYEDF